MCMILKDRNHNRFGLLQTVTGSPVTIGHGPVRFSVFFRSIGLDLEALGRSGLGLLLALGSGNRSCCRCCHRGSTQGFAQLKGLEMSIKRGNLCLNGSEHCLKSIHR